MDDTGYVQPTYRAAARRARHALDLSQQQPSRSWLVQDSGEVKNVQLS
jgi:sulfane dehydrogenase subunit SoxC